MVDGRCCMAVSRNDSHGVAACSHFVIHPYLLCSYSTVQSGQSLLCMPAVVVARGRIFKIDVVDYEFKILKYFLQKT